MDILMPLTLTPQVQHYHWGKQASDSLVAQLLDQPIEHKPYAELWIGAHPQAPSIAQGIHLNDLIRSNPTAILGNDIAKKFSNSLPYLFKILSIAKPLSIQAHPNKSLAEKLHAKDPANYPDSNHKPEVAIALSELRLLYGFRTFSEIKLLAGKVPELTSLINDAVDTRGALSQIVSKDKESLREKLANQLIDRLKSSTSTNESEKLILEIASDYGAKDLGIFTSLILNLCTIKPGQAIYVGPGVPHAYLSGDLAECMANSDNVVRGGITPKFQDIETLIEMLDYESTSPNIILAQKDPELSYLFRYKTPSEEFQIEKIESDKPISTIDKSYNSPILIFVLNGALTVSNYKQPFTVHRGKAIMIPACLSEYTISYDQGVYFKVTVPI